MDQIKRICARTIGSGLINSHILIAEYLAENEYSAIILAVGHNEFMKIDLKVHKEKGCIIYDVKGILNQAITDGRL